MLLSTFLYLTSEVRACKLIDRTALVLPLLHKGSHMTKECFIGIDLGSSSTKALVIGAEGQELLSTRRDLAPPLRKNDRVEQDAAELAQSVQAALEESAHFAASTGHTVLGVGLSCQRSSCLIWNESTGAPLSPVLSWRDTRGAEFINRIAEQGPRIFEATGLPLTPYYSASKFRWLKENIRAAEEKTTVFGTLSSFLTQRLTGSPHAVIDHANAARTQLMNARSLAWDQDLIALFELSGIRLPELTPTCSRFGTIHTRSGAFPLLACIGDQQAALLGLGVVRKNDGGINYGTGGFLLVNTGAELVPVKGLMASLHYSSDHERSYLLEGSVNAAGDALEWLRARLGLFEEYAEVDDLCWRAVGEAVVFIGLNGTGSPHWETGISSALHGLTADSCVADVVRGTIEGIAFFMKDIAEAMRSSGVEPASYVVSGGLSQLSYLVQFQADLLGKDLIVSAGQEVSALGAALLAGLEHGSWTPERIRALARGGEPVAGERNPGGEKRYRRWKELHRITRELDRMP